MYSILLVDDEQVILTSLKKVLTDESYNVHTAESGEKGLEILEQNNVDLIISDLVMPNMNGLEFIREAAKVSPYSLKMILSGASDLDTVVGAINSGMVWKYLFKPWKKEDLLVTIRKAVEYYQVKQNNLVLMGELKEKNRQLADMNCLLEGEVEKRTTQISIINKLLIDLLEGVAIDDIMHNITHYVSELLTTKKVSLIVPGESGFNTFSECEMSNENAVRKMIDLIKETKKPYCENGVHAFPVIDDEALYAIVMVKDPMSCDMIQKKMKPISVIIKFAVQRYRLVDQSSNIMSDIDYLLEKY